MSNPHNHKGKINIEGKELMLREVNVDGEIFNIPQHIVPICLRDKNRDIKYKGWQVRLGTPYKSFSTIEKAKEELSLRLRTTDMRAVLLFRFNEAKNKKYITGMPGVLLRPRVDRNSMEFVLLFKSKVKVLVCANLTTLTEKKAKDILVKIFIIKMYLLALVIKENSIWEKLLKKNLDDLVNYIDTEFYNEAKKEALAKVSLDGFRRLKAELKALPTDMYWEQKNSTVQSPI